jgi:DNA-binding CsgD family transcriptional regulator/putative methionine-R-sulfoxide reductase with GAF domain
MMKLDNHEEIQYLLDITSKQLNVDVLIMDQEANKVMGGSKLLCEINHILNEDQLHELKSRFTQIFGNISDEMETQFFEMFPGLKIAIVPIPLDTRYCLISGFFLGIPDALMLQHVMERELGRRLPDFPFADCPFLGEQKESVVAELNRLGRHITNILSHLQNAKKTKRYLDSTIELSNLFSAPASIETKFLKAAEVLKAINPFQAMGLMVPISKGRYKVQYSFYGNEPNPWKDYEFEVGEGFFGWSIMTQQACRWNDVTEDPRYYSIRSVFQTLRSLSIFPLYQAKENVGLLFFASEATGLFDEDWMQYIQCIAPLYQHELALQGYESKVDYMSQKISILMGISQLLTSNTDPQRILGIVVDFLMSIDGVDQSFGVLLNESQNQILFLVGRGISTEEIKRHCNEYLDKKIDELTTDKQVVFPIRIHDRTIGWFYIGSQQKIQHKDIMFTNTMVNVAATVLKSNILLKKTQSGIDPIEVLVKLLSYKDSNSYKHSERVKNWVGLICSQLNVDDETRNTIGQCALLHEVWRLVSDRKEPTEESVHLGLEVLELFPALRRHSAILKDQYKTMNEGGPLKLKGEKTPLTSKIFAIAHHFDTLLENTDPDSDQVFKIINVMEQQKGSHFDPDVLDAFSYAMKRRYSITISNVDLVETQKQDKADTFFPGLSPRELEVITLMAKGQSNKEIAATLHISEHTVKNHVSNIFQKLNLSDRTSVVSLAYQKGLIQ